MTRLPEPLPVGPGFVAPAPPPPRAHPAGLAIAWSVILLSVATVLFLHYAHLHLVAAPPGPPPATPTLAMSAKYAVGATDWLGKRSGADLATGVLNAAHTPLEKLRAATVVGELDGGPAAVRVLTGVQAKSPTLTADRDLLLRVYRAGPQTLTPAERHDLIAHHRWFGKLALAFDQPAGSAARQAALAPAHEAFVATLVLAIVGFGLCFVGLALLVLGIVLLALHKLVLRLRATWRSTSAYLEAVALYIPGLLGLQVVTYLFITHDLVGGIWFTLPVIALALAWPRIRGQSTAEWRTALGLHTGGGVFKEMGCGIAGYVAGLPLVAAAAILVQIITRLGHFPTPTHPLEQDLGGSGWHVLGIYLVASGFAPITEELMFRGALFGHLRQRWNFWIAALVTAFIFAIIHPQGVLAVPVLMALAFVFCCLRQWRGSIIATMTAHALHNAIVTTVMILVLRS